jgi:hypothetical protein
MQLSAVDLMAFMLFSQILLAGLVVYSFLDQEREQRRHTNAMFGHMERLVAELEKRLASGQFRGADELDRIIARNAEQAKTGSPPRAVAPPRAHPAT